ncbi:MAG: bifunctional 4-hydroxy-2-oxoglutarate aldolase/2-dehydro-3-deoxy-phosphogluconate aldolase [Pseudomonadota bacterium]
MTPAEASSHLLEIAKKAPVIPVLVIDDAAKAADMAEALVAGGLPILEVTLRTPAALAAMEAMAQIPGSIVGAGTVLTADQAKAAKDAGATFAVSPGSTPKLIDALEAIELPALPGIATSSEAMALLERGYTFLKFFPAEAIGGAPAVKSMASPLQQISFCPTGGITPEIAPSYLKLPNVVCVGGSWVAPKAAVDAGDWDKVRDLAANASGLLPA